MKRAPGTLHRVVVIGVGNPFREDDGLGIEVARRLRALLPEGVQVIDHDGEPAGLLDAWDGADLAVVVDAVLTRGSRPGEVHRVELDGRRSADVVRPLSSHGISAGDAVELAEALERLPARLVLYGVEGKSFGTGTELSPEVEAAVPAVVKGVLEEVRS